MTFGEHIRQWREERGVGLRRFAKAIGVSPTFVSKMERGEGPLPGEKTIRKMAVYFGKNPDELLAMGLSDSSDSHGQNNMSSDAPGKPDAWKQRGYG